ncbi:carboxymuconolactone decarboxylase family protein [Acuticoccus sediminis]|uniref:carboxymuconolactone decarboxylase family protein n=1 Tax=Acuticoccus sediminis TaxID=2184697 RepID=UPI001391AACE|nr:carboxymuconolactone decarboxylase family protein [Acuticoccus sediminis]
MDELEELEARLAALKAERGYLLPHHGLMATFAPDLLEAYGAAYRAMTLTDRVLSPHEKEFVWLTILIATDEAEATHHVAKFYAAGGTDREVEAVVRLTALVRGAAAYRFVTDAWQRHLNTWDGAAAERAAGIAVAAEFGVAPGLVLLADAAMRVCLDDWDGLGRALVDLSAAGVEEAKIAEALSLTMFPGSVPRFVRAAGVWLTLIREGKVAASPRTRAWAALSGQGGYDEAAS